MKFYFLIIKLLFNLNKNAFLFPINNYFIIKNLFNKKSNNIWVIIFNVINLNYYSQIRTFMEVDWGVWDEAIDVTYRTESNQGFGLEPA